MAAQTDLELLGTLHDGRHTRVVQARRPESGERLVLKMLKDAIPSPDLRVRFKYEYDLTRRLSERASGVIGVGELRRSGHSLIMELEDVGARSLASAVAATGPCLGDLGRALEVAVELARAVAQIHQADVLHLGLCPENLLLHPSDGTLRVIDFGQASELTLENAEASNTNLPLELLHYVAPEQSGRMNRTIDNRADLYSLGATLYYLFSGHAPFDADERKLDTVALIHAHIARTPVPLSERNADVPEAVSQIVDRLLRKNVAERYQTAAGLTADLERCLEQYRTNGRVASFGLAESDHVDKLVPSQHLFGRDEEIRVLGDCFERCRASSVEVAFVHGYSGIGKSALVNALQGRIALAEGQFVSGKFDINLRDQPYTAFVQALRTLVSQRLAASRSENRRLAADLKTSLGPNGRIITDAIPELEVLVGPQPPVAEIGAEENLNRFGRVIESFLQAMASERHPLVIFLDDLQWADTPSLNLVRQITRSDGLKHILIIGAYRDNEVDDAHPLTLLREALDARGTPVLDVDLGPIGVGDVAEMIGAMIRRPADEIGDLAQVCFEKTGGNPFFLNQFLQAIENEGLLSFDHSGNAWIWDTQAIRDRAHTNNVVDLVVERIRRMPDEAVDILKVAAAIGNRFSLSMLAAATGNPPEAVAHTLWPLLRDNLILPLSDNYRIAQSESEAASDTSYRFLHDRVQQAAYSLHDDVERRRVHLRISETLARDLSEDSPRRLWFDVATHSNIAADLFEAKDKLRLAELNLGAGRRAKVSAAFESAAEYLRFGLAALPDKAWDDHYCLTLDLHIEATEAAYLTHDFERMDALIAETETRTRDLLDLVRLRDIQIRSYIARDKRLQALDVALPLLADLGAAIVATPTDADYGAAFGAAEGAIAGREVADLIDLPEMTDPNARAAMRIVCQIFSCAYFAAPQLMPLIIAKLVELSGRFGNTGESAFGYAIYGLNLCAFQGDIERGFAFGELSRKVLDRYDARALRARTLFIATICVTHWKRPLRATLAPLLEAYQSGLDTGDMEYSTHSLMIHSQALFAVGHPLKELHERMAGHRAAIEASKEEGAISLFAIYHQTVANWMTPSDNPALLVGENYDETVRRPMHEAVGDRTALFHLHFQKMVLAYGFGLLDEAKALATKTRELLDGAVGVYQIPLFHFYESLVLLATGTAFDDARIVENQGILEGWARHCPENNLHRWHLVEAVRAASDGDPIVAADHFDKAGTLAGQNRFVQEEALAHELHAAFWRDRGNVTLARAFLEQANKCHALWGSEAKLADLAARYAGLMPEGARGEDEPTAATIDIETVLKAAQAFAGSTGLEDLLSRMMQITIENAGARRGLLLLHANGQDVSAAEASAETDKVDLHSRFSIESLEDMSDEASFLVAAARYVARTELPLVLDEATSDPRFGTDPYVARNKTRSVLCMPLGYQGRLVAVLYLENDLAQGAFTEDRLELLNMLSGQMAVLIESARHYDDVIRINRAFERFVPKQYVGFLGRDSIVDVQLGDQVSRDMTVMFVDIRDFTTLSDRMTPEATFAFINEFLQTVEPQVRRNGGIVDKFTGDGLMALFPDSADDAVRGSIDILGALDRLNARRADAGAEPIRIGIGVHSGRLMLGTIGGQNRMDGTVISAVVNLASRIEGLNKTYGTRILISETTWTQLHDPAAYKCRRLGEVQVKGGSEASLFEVFDGDAADVAARKERTRQPLDAALEALARGDDEAARASFESVLDIFPGDGVALFHLSRLEPATRMRKTVI